MFARGCAAADGYEYGSECDNESHDGKKGGEKNCKQQFKLTSVWGFFFWGGFADGGLALRLQFQGETFY